MSGRPPGTASTAVAFDQRLAVLLSMATFVLVGLLTSFGMMRQKDIKPSVAGEGLAFG